MKIFAIAMAGVLVAACFFPWVTIEPQHIEISGFYSTVSTFGKPGLFHVILCGLFVLFLLIGKIWSIRIAFFIGAFNIAWALRNYIAISACSGGLCPEKHIALYLLPVTALLMVVFTAMIRVKNQEAKG